MEQDPKTSNVKHCEQLVFHSGRFASLSVYQTKKHHIVLYIDLIAAAIFLALRGMDSAHVTIDIHLRESLASTFGIAQP
jgi:hypothetical protein